MKTFDILVLNPKDHETQIAVYEKYKLLYLVGRKHNDLDAKMFPTMYDQVEYRRDIVLKELHNNEFDTSAVKIVISRGGLIRPVKSGVYEVNEPLKHDLKNSPVGEDIINIGGLLVDAIASTIPGAMGLIADPPVVDELEDIARITGIPEIQRKSIFHALNQKAIAKHYCETHKKKYDEINLIIVHLGNGTTVGAHYRGRVIDVNQGFAGDGPFSMTRSGTLPAGEIVKLCFSGTKSQEAIQCMLTQCGGLLAHLGTTSIIGIENMIKEGDEHAIKVIEAMAYQVAKCVGEMYAVLKGEVEAIIITGELAHMEYLVKHILEYIRNFAPPYVYPGDNEMKSMAENAVRVLNGEMTVQNY